MDVYSRVLWCIFNYNCIKLRISCSKLILSELSSFKESLESTPRSLSSLSDSKQAFKTSYSDKSFLGPMFVVAVFSLKLDKIQDVMQSSRYGLCSVGYHRTPCS